MKIIDLPPALKEFVRPLRHALLSTSSSDGAVLIAKMPATDIESCQGRLPVHVRYELHNAQSGPALRLVLTFHDHPDDPLMMETFFNPSDPQQIKELEDLLSRDHLRILLYDEEVRHRLSKRVTQPENEDRHRLIPEARRLLAETDPHHLDFDYTKALIMYWYPLGADS